ncbi:MAG: hypothetical protein IPO23_13075 [Flavobacterium sp.]|nr:hypothetical protein [Flavobacterium sp.]
MKKIKTKIKHPKSKQNLKFNGNLNQLVDMFYQQIANFLINGKPYIDENTNDIADWIVNSS